jgi:hypothetical protein
MAQSQHFDIGFLITEGKDEHAFLSVTPGFEHGPGIQRDGITSPRMTDPHSVRAVTNGFGLHNESWKNLPATTNPFVQRAGTWTLYHHLKRFVQTYGKEWRVIAVQSNGDLTMNYWHAAYIKNYGPERRPMVCCLLTVGDTPEPIGTRVYRSLVKWDKPAAAALGRNYETTNLRFDQQNDGGWTIRAADLDDVAAFDNAFRVVPEYNRAIHDIGPLIDFTLSGKTIVERGIGVSLSSAIDKFDDVRHIFNLPEVRASGFFGGHQVSKVNFGEFHLFQNLNERRAALYSPIIIGLDIGGHGLIEESIARETLLRRHYRESEESPTRRGQFRRYTDQEIEVFFPHNVYPFGVIGLRPSSSSDQTVTTELVALSSGGLSGRVGNTLEGITQITYDFFGCTDAMVLDEGYDVFFVRNPTVDGAYRYSNCELLERVLSFTNERANADAREALKESKDYALGTSMSEWPLNKQYFDELDKDFARSGQKDFADIMMVTPNRSQMRSVLIYAVREESLGNRPKEMENDI